ncbi:MAG: toll/interleukin-1 receptor domain-containing protein [Deltaproteobacteria bacterium]|nr:toll/interleukin-1 receptor domain-containing protein [Deltaproteobacteria bacterium]
MPKIFISHSKIDKRVAQGIVRLLRLSLKKLEAEDIRCTSVEGYGLDGGVRIDDSLRHELLDSPIFIGLITQYSVQSVWVLFELGARWGAARSMILLLPSKTSNEILPAPISTLTALQIDSRPDLLRMISQVANELGLDEEKAYVYTQEIDEIISIVNEQYHADPILEDITHADPSTPVHTAKQLTFNYGFRSSDSTIILKYTIDFDYKTSQIENKGWIITPENPEQEKPNVQIVSDTNFIKILNIESFKRYRMDREIDHSYNDCTVVEYIVKPGEDYSLYISAYVKKTSGDSKQQVWLNIKIGSQNNTKFKDDEWTIFVQPTPTVADWKMLSVNVPKSISETFGNEGWDFVRLQGIRVRGSIMVARIHLYK